MAGRTEWVLLSYRLPREPSNPRVVLWRKLRQLGAAQLGDGLVALPADARTKEQFEWLAEGILESGGTSTVWIAQAGSARQERELIHQMRARVEEEYEAILNGVASVLSLDPPDRRRAVTRLKRDLRKIASRDFFPPPLREQARFAVQQLNLDMQIEVMT